MKNEQIILNRRNVSVLNSCNLSSWTGEHVRHFPLIKLIYYLLDLNPDIKGLAVLIQTMVVSRQVDSLCILRIKFQ
jgi:hypothetical protein